LFVVSWLEQFYSAAWFFTFPMLLQLKLLLIGDTAKLCGDIFGLRGVNACALLKFESELVIEEKLRDFYDPFL